MKKKIKIALLGKSGAGKTEVANYLHNNYGFQIINVGKRVRELAKEFFNTESKTILQQITDGFNIIKRGIWLELAIKEIDLNRNVVIDNIRFIEDYNLLKKKNYFFWRVESDLSIRMERLTNRGQVYSILDEKHQSETELDNIDVDFVIPNKYSSFNQLHTYIKLELSKKYFITLP